MAGQSMCLDLSDGFNKCINLMTKLSQNFLLFLLLPLAISLQAQNDPDVPAEVSDEAAALRALIREYDAKSSGGSATRMAEKSVTKVEDEAEKLKREAEEAAKAKEQAKETIASVTALIDNEIESADSVIEGAAVMNLAGETGSGPAAAGEGAPPIAPGDVPTVPGPTPEMEVPQVSIGTDRIILNDPGMSPPSPPAEEVMTVADDAVSDPGTTPSFAPDESLNLTVPQDPPAEGGDAAMAQSVAPAPEIGTETPPEPMTVAADPASADDATASTEPADPVAGVDMKPPEPADAPAVEGASVGTEETITEEAMAASAEEARSADEPAERKPEKPTAVAIKKSEPSDMEVASASGPGESDQPRAVARQLAPKFFQNLFPRKGSIFKRQTAEPNDGALDSSDDEEED